MADAEQNAAQYLNDCEAILATRKLTQSAPVIASFPLETRRNGRLDSAVAVSGLLLGRSVMRKIALTKKETKTVSSDCPSPCLSACLSARHLRWRSRSADPASGQTKPKRPLRRIGRRLGVLAVTLMLPAIGQAGDLPECASGFTQAAQTKSVLTCIRTEKVESEADADDMSKSIHDAKGCDGRVTEQRASVADSADGGWLVTMLFSCADGD